uniref:Retrovirus-related Pol polyprotein from transposon TNT 1-94 n=1 Tax=Tanacetum cinerariifolium TaxID=118510 RepID=A0A6L2JGP8_TANCI|nr:hypothetical protein [Tanacetum cinerariifolium]
MDNKAYKKQEKIYYPRFTKVIIHHFLTQDKTLSRRNKIRMHTYRDDYLINTLRFIYTKKETQIYGAILPECLTSLKMKETQAYKTYLGFATGAKPPKKLQKLKKPASPKLTTVLVSTETPTRKSKRVKTPAKKSTKTPARGVVIRETLEMPLTKKKEKVDVTHGKGIELLSQVVLTEDAQFKELRNKRMRDFYKSHPSRFGTVTKTAPSVAKIKPSATSEGTGVRPGVLDVAEEESSENNEFESDLEHENDVSESGSEFDHDESEEDDDEEDETKITDKVEGDKDEKMDYTTGQLYDDVDIRLNEPVDTDKGFVQEEGTDAAMTNVQQGNENPKILQVIEDAHMTLFTVPQKTKRSQKDKDEDPSVRSDRGLKKRKTSKDVEPRKGPKAKESHSGSSKGVKSQSKSSRKFVQLEKLYFEVVDSYMPQYQEENPRNDDEEPKDKGASKHDWFTKPSQPQEPTNPNWNVGKTL